MLIPKYVTVDDVKNACLVVLLSNCLLLSTSGCVENLASLVISLLFQHIWVYSHYP